MAIETDRLISAAPTSPQEQRIEQSLRPSSLADYVGQEKIRGQFEIFIQAARERREALDHVLLFGPPGLGKTTLAHIIAREMGVNLRQTSGPVLERPGDLAALLTNLEPRDVLFIDEIHRLSPVVEEILYPALEDYQIDIMIGEGPAARSIKLDLPAFTLVGATTRAGMLTNPLRDRFGIVARLEFYNEAELSSIVRRSAGLLEVKLADEGASEIARRSRGTPRVANRLLRRVRDYAQVKADGVVSTAVADAALKMLDVDALGLDLMDRKLMLAVIEKFSGGPVGIENLAAAIGEERDTIEDVLEPYLIQQGYLQRTLRGRIATLAAYRHFGIMAPAGMRDLLTQSDTGAPGGRLTRLAADAGSREALEAAAQRQQFFARLHGRMPRLRVTPVVVGANVVVFVLMLFAGAGMLQPDANVHLAWGANYGPATKEGGWWRLLASTFLHYGVVHVAFNMWALTDAGRLVERLYGSTAFLALYLFSGLTGSFASLLWSADRVVSVGASGAVFGVYGALFAYLVAQRGSVPAIVLRGLATSAAIFIGYVLVFGALQKGIDNAAHVGGLLGGIVAGFALSGPLEPGALRSPSRHMLAALGAAAVLGLLWSLVPPARYSYAAQLAAERAINATSADEAVAMGRARTVLDARKRGELSEAETATRLEREVVVALDVAYRRLAAIELSEQAPARRQLALLTQYTAAKRDLFAAYAQGLRSGDEAKLRRADELADESQRLLEEIKRLPRRPPD